MSGDLNRALLAVLEVVGAGDAQDTRPVSSHRRVCVQVLLGAQSLEATGMDNPHRRRHIFSERPVHMQPAARIHHGRCRQLGCINEGRQRHSGICLVDVGLAYAAVKIKEKGAQERSVIRRPPLVGVHK